MKEERKEMEEEWKGGREGCLAFRGTLISFLGCYTSRHCLRFAISPLTRHAVWAHSSPAEQNYLAKQWSENWENGAVMVLAGWKRTLYLHVVCWYIRSSNLWLSFELQSHKMCLNSFNNRHRRSTWIDRRDVKSNLICSSCVQEPICDVQTLCVCVCVRPSCPHVALISAVISSIGLRVMVHLWTCEGTACGILALKMKVMVEKKTSRGFGSTNRNTMLHPKKKKKLYQLWLSWEEQQLRAHLWCLAAILAAKLGSRRSVVHLLNVLSVTKR